MVTADEVAQITVFAGLDEADRERLARVAADITLLPGEFAAQEGDERALFALIEGRIEAVKTVDGIDKVVGRRGPGDIFGEVPIVIGTKFPVGFRAAEQSRVMRVEPSDYHTVAAAAPDVAAEVGRLAAERMSGPRGLQGIAAEPHPPRAVVFGKRADAECAGAPPLPRAQPDLLPVGHAGRAGRGGGVGRSAAGRRRLPDHPLRRRQDGGQAPAAPRRGAPGAGHRGRRRRVRHGRRRRRPVRPGGRRVRRLRGAADHRRRARGARRPGRHLLAHRELPRLPLRRLRRRALQPSAAAGAAARRRDPRDPRDHAHRPGRPTRCAWTAATCCAPGRSSSPAASRGGASTSRASTASPARGSSTAPHAARRPTRTASTCTSSAPATRPGRRPCSSPRMPAA